ncbi:uncharacterized protein [Apostichopus japonicus]|uniref:uncharacterized protein isoform X2 n=1 Tax=Stichopus japonicus TaxID=307972 RepID=UPI003AB25B8B
MASCNRKNIVNLAENASQAAEVAAEVDYEQEDSDQDDSIDQPGDIKKGHSLNYAKKLEPMPKDKQKKHLGPLRSKQQSIVTYRSLHLQHQSCLESQQ